MYYCSNRNVAPRCITKLCFFVAFFFSEYSHFWQIAQLLIFRKAYASRFCPEVENKLANIMPICHMSSHAVLPRVQQTRAWHCCRTWSRRRFRGPQWPPSTDRARGPWCPCRIRAEHLDVNWPQPDFPNAVVVHLNIFSGHFTAVCSYPLRRQQKKILPSPQERRSLKSLSIATARSIDHNQTFSTSLHCARNARRFCSWGSQKPFHLPHLLLAHGQRIFLQ